MMMLKMFWRLALIFLLSINCFSGEKSLPLKSSPFRLDCPLALDPVAETLRRQESEYAEAKERANRNRTTAAKAANPYLEYFRNLEPGTQQVAFLERVGRILTDRVAAAHDLKRIAFHFNRNGGTPKSFEAHGIRQGWYFSSDTVTLYHLVHDRSHKAKGQGLLGDVLVMFGLPDAKTPFDRSDVGQTANLPSSEFLCPPIYLLGDQEEDKYRYFLENREPNEQHLIQILFLAYSAGASIEWHSEMEI